AGFHRCVGPYRRDPSIGRPIANLRMMVLDPRGNPVPVGVPGELWVGGTQTARGYWNRPALTAQRLVPDPTSEEPGARAYRSGDLVRLLPDGEIEFLGRIDRQVKLRGLRIELGEIEATLAEHPGVRECTVMVREDNPGESLLAAYLVPVGEAAPEARELRDFLASKLPSYMIPGVFVMLDAMPLSPTGKVDRKALPVPAETRAARESVAPRNPAEQTLVDIWRQVLNRETVGVHDNFFELGGDSILGIQVVSRAQQAGFGLTARDLFQHQTVAELAELAAAAGPGESAEIPLTAGQRALLERTAEADLGGLFELRRFAPREDVDPARLEQALRRVVERHDALRVRFVREEGGWRQLPAEATVTLETSEGPLRAGFDLGSDGLGGPLVRAALVEAADWTQRLVLAIHRLAADRASWRLLLHDLEAAYRGNEMPPVPVSFQQWATRPATSPPVPGPVSRTAAWIGAPYSLAVELGADETRSLLEEVGPAFRTRVEDAVLTAMVEAFANGSGERRLRIDVESDGRRELPDGLDASRTVGRLATAAPVLLELNSAAQSPGERLKAVKEQLRATGPSDRTPAEPAEALFRALEPGAAPAPEPALFAPLLNEPAESETGHPLEITAEVVDGQLRLAWSFDEGRYDESTIQRLADGTVASLRSLIEHCRTGEGGGFTASDFPEARFSQKDLDSLMSQLGKRKLKAGPAGSK
ncbi:MAG TPA: condensation domain-containing protein, partial [Thermoanaerobaculia bacterium]|nr:condensation domain-containing protein [Thermoanaerobaculia bacterium]